MPLDPLWWIHVGQATYGILLLWRFMGVPLEWHDRWQRRDDAAQFKQQPETYWKMRAIRYANPTLFAKTKTRTKSGTTVTTGGISLFALAGLAGTAAIILITWAAPALATAATGVGLAVRGIRGQDQPEEEVPELRAGLGHVIGLDGKGRPPAVDLHGEHVAGGPQEITIHPHPGWPHWEQKRQDQVERVIEVCLDGDWSLVRWQKDATNRWQRQPELPTRWDYEHHFAHLGDLELPLGLDGISPDVRGIDLQKVWHIFVGGPTGAGKTSWERQAIAHLLARKQKVACLDIGFAGLACFEGRPGVLAAVDSFEQIQDATAALRQELRDRRIELRRHRTYRPALVTFVAELEVLFDEARRIGTKTSGGHPQLIADILAIGRQGRQVRMHLVLDTQQPEGKTIPTALRNNCRGRIAFGRMNRHLGEMLLDDDWPRATSCLDIGGRGTARAGAWIGAIHAGWFADPDDPDHPKKDRDRAASLLPARTTVPVITTAPPATGGPSDQTVPAELKDKWPVAGGPTSGLTESAGVVVPGEVISQAEQDARADLAHLRARRAANQRDYRKRAALRCAENPNDPLHGTPTGRAVCKCEVCRPELHR